MTKISSNWTVFYKRILPTFWLAILTLLTVVAVAIETGDEPLEESAPLMIAALVGMGVVGLLVGGRFSEALPTRRG